MGKQLIHFFIDCTWEYLRALRAAHRQAKVELIEVWEGQKPKMRQLHRKEFWQYIHARERALEDHLDRLGQHRDHVMARCVSSEKDILPLREVSGLDNLQYEVREVYIKELNDSLKSMQQVADDASVDVENLYFIRMVSEFMGPHYDFNDVIRSIGIEYSEKLTNKIFDERRNERREAS